MTPTRRVAGAVALWLVLEWYGAASEVAWLFLLAAWVLALVVAALAYAAWNRAGLRLHLSAIATRPAAGSPAEDISELLARRAPWAAPVFEGDALELEVGLEVAGSERGPAWVTGSVGGMPVRFGTGLVPRAGWRRSQALQALRRGPVGATGWQVGTSDPLGFFRSTRSWPDSEVAVALPRFASLVTMREPRDLESSMAAPRAGSGNEVFGVREYRAGDSLRRIHWRSSARRSELVVREYEPPGVQTLAIIVDPAPPTLEVADQVARIAASEAWDCVRDGGRVVIGGPGLEPTVATRDLWVLLEWLARYPNSFSGPSVGFADTSPRVGRSHLLLNGADPSSTVLVTADPELLDTPAVRRWLVGEADGPPDVSFQRVGLGWPL